MKITFIGVGNVGAPLADHLQKLGHSVAIAARDPHSQSVQAALSRNANFEVKKPIEAVNAAEVVFLATPFTANEAAFSRDKFCSGWQNSGRLHQSGGCQPITRTEK